LSSSYRTRRPVTATVADDQVEVVANHGQIAHL
jgi:hypothetical protein